LSDTVTRAPARARKRTRSMPSMPSPTTVTRAPSRFGAGVIASELLVRVTVSYRQGQRDAREAACDAHDPEAGDHLWLAPAEQFEVVVERRLAEDAPPARGLEVGDLDDVGQRFGDEDEADQREQQ